ncbi:MAG: hydrogenase maturation protein [Motiliproteus sp.]
MRILFLTHSFNSLTQRLFVELQRRGHEVSIEFDINDAVAEEAVALFAPELIVAPFLKRAIPESIWKNHRCIIVHPGIRGDRGPSSVDWAIMRGDSHWGVTCLQADAEMDAGDIWSSVEFPMRKASKSSLYRNEITEAALQALLQTISRVQQGEYQPQPLDYENADIRGTWHELMTQQDRAIDWQRDSSAQVLTKIRAADSMPGLRDDIAGRSCFLYNACEEGRLRGKAGELIARRDGAICRATVDGAVWISHLRLADREEGEPNFKLPAEQLLLGHLTSVPEDAMDPEQQPGYPTLQEIRYRQSQSVGYLHFDFCNGAMDTDQCLRLRNAVAVAKRRDIKVLVLMGGSEFWSNGIHLNQIEAAESPADESWRNINAMDDLCLEIIESPDIWVMAAMQGNAGAGGVFFALTADQVLARSSVILNPHYKSMGNLFGSEYWTYLLPRRVGEHQSTQLTQNRLPIGAAEAQALGLLDERFDGSSGDFISYIQAKAEQLAASPKLDTKLGSKSTKLHSDHLAKPLEEYRREELEQMKLNFYGFDPSYHVARYHFVEKLPKARTPVYLAKHRRIKG